jgi:hypothetical protein
MTHASTVATKIAERLQAISIANGYATDIGLRVYRGRRRVEDNHMPCITIVEGDDKIIDDGVQGNALLAQQYHIEAHTACDPNNPNDAAHLMIGDMKKALFGADITFARTVRKFLYRGRMILPRDDGLAVVAANITVEAVFPESLANP